MVNEKREILIVEDDPELQWNLGRVLLREGFSITSCNDGQEAISILTSRAFDFVITDIALPRASGLVVADWVKKNRPGIPVIVMTAIGSPMMKELSLLKGATHYFEKPVDHSSLLSILSRSTPDKLFVGSVHDVQLLDFLQFLILSGKQVRLEIVSISGERGHLFIDSGSVVHAICGELIGKEAFFRCVGFPGGRFAELEWQAPETITIDLPAEFLLFESARRTDDSKSEEERGNQC